MTIYEQILARITAAADPARAAVSARFFQTGPGQYAEGDIFAGLTMRQVRTLAKDFAAQATAADIAELFTHPLHEARSVAALLCVEKYTRAKTAQEQAAWVEFYIAHLPQCNNWDLIDCSAYKILGPYYYNRQDTRTFERLARSKNLWEQRAAIVGTMYWVKQGRVALTLKLAARFCAHPHPLIHKASGWLLREVGKKEEKALLRFLDVYAPKMPRVMLRYALERLPVQVRKKYMCIPSEKSAFAPACP